MTNTVNTKKKILDKNAEKQNIYFEWPEVKIYLRVFHLDH